MLVSALSCVAALGLLAVVGLVVADLVTTSQGELAAKPRLTKAQLSDLPERDEGFGLDELCTPGLPPFDPQDPVQPGGGSSRQGMYTAAVQLAQTLRSHPDTVVRVRPNASDIPSENHPFMKTLRDFAVFERDSLPSGCEPQLRQLLSEAIAAAD